MGNVNETLTAAAISETAANVANALDLDRAVELVQEVCRIPSVLGEEGELAMFLASVMSESGFEDVQLQPVLPDRPNATGNVSLGEGPNVVLTGHLDTKPVSHGWSVTEPFSGALIDGSVYGHGVMDMKAALACQIVAIEAVRASGLPMRGTLSMAAVADHMGDQLGSIAYFDASIADLCVLGELTDNQVCLGHRGRYYFDITTHGRSAHTCHKDQAINANALAAQAVLALEASRYEPELVAHMIGDRGHAEGASHRQAARAHGLDRDDLTGQCRLHVHDAVAVDRPVDQRAREGLGHAPAVGDGLRVQVPGQHHRRTLAEGDLADRVGSVGQHGLKLHVLETRLRHHRREEPRELALLTEDRRDPAYFLHELDRAIQIEGPRDVGRRVRDRRRRERLVDVSHEVASPALPSTDLTSHQVSDISRKLPPLCGGVKLHAIAVV
jgi:hypothetical protein